MKELLEKAVENGTIWLIIGSLISSDNLVSKEDCEKSLAIVKDMQMTMLEGDLKMDAPTYNKIMKYLDEAEDIITGDMNKLKGN